MFTGLVEKTGKIVSFTRQTPVGQDLKVTQLIVDAGKDYEVSPGDSVAVNGCCLTVVSNKVSLLAFDISSETLDRTSLKFVVEGSEINLERALRIQDRLGGHLVSGHVDTTGTVVELNKNADSWLLRVGVPQRLSRYVIEKGSICIDGVSLTVNRVLDDKDVSDVSMSLIPATIGTTHFRNLAVGQIVNIEVDMIAKYIERLARFR